MREQMNEIKNTVWDKQRFVPIALLVAVVIIIAPSQTVRTTSFVLGSLVFIAPMAVPGIVISAWIAASGAGDQIVRVFEGRMARTIFVAAGIGAVTPVCGVTVLPLMAGLLAARVPFAPIMAFWLSSPVTDPAMFAATGAILGWKFSLAKTAFAFFIGLAGGTITAMITPSRWTTAPLRNNELVAGLGVRPGERQCGLTEGYNPAFWSVPARRSVFYQQIRSLIRLLLICLIPAFAAEYWLNATLHPEALASFVGVDAWWATPLAVTVGAPAYLNGYAALPLARSMMEHGMAPGAAMGFLISGGIVSIWGAMAIFPVLRMRPFLLFLMLALAGSMAAGFLFGLIA